MPDDDQFHLHLVRTLAFSTVGDPTGSEVARMLRLAADGIEGVATQVQHVAAHTEPGPSGPVLHLRFFWMDPGANDH